MKHTLTAVVALAGMMAATGLHAQGTGGQSGGGAQGEQPMMQGQTGQQTQQSPGMTGQGGMTGGQQGSGMQAQMSEETVREIQRALSEAGYDPGPQDGQMGEQTRSALQEFQQAQGMEATGELDARTLAALGVDSELGGGLATSPSGSDAIGSGLESGSRLPQTSGEDDSATSPETGAQSGTDGGAGGTTGGGAGGTTGGDTGGTTGGGGGGTTGGGAGGGAGGGSGGGSGGGG